MSLACIGVVFNDEPEVYHPFDYDEEGNGDLVQRRKWEMAKLHMASVELNDFIFRDNIGTVHYATSIYTTAFVNIARQKR